MRYRYRLSLYDDSDLDKEIADYLTQLVSSNRKQEMLRTFIRAGYAMVIKKQGDDLAYLSSISDHDKSAILRKAMAAPLGTQPHGGEGNPFQGKQNREAISGYTRHEQFSHQVNRDPVVISGYTRHEQSSASPDSINKQKDPGGSMTDNKPSIAANPPQDIASGDPSSGPDDPVDFMTLLQQ